MSLFVIFIIICSTFMHAGWNLLARYNRAERDFYFKMLVIMVVTGFVPAVWSELVTRSLTPTAWWCVLGSGFSAGLYLFFLARAYEESDFTVVYPVARSLPVIFVAFIDVLRGRELTVFGWLGILMVAAGCVFVPLRSFRDFSLGNYFNRASLWMFFAALGTVGYTTLDKIAAEVVQQGPATAARYGYIYFAVSFFPYLGFMKLSRPVVVKDSSQDWKIAVLAALFGFGAYWLILWAYQLSPYASYIVAFRQFSIVIGALLAFIIYKEQGVAVRLSGAVMITLGLVLIALLGR
ncbi:MAG TPA: EamA family transporter [Anaerolineales bacterium]|nr:EamA family transporter [Anaerolineales bacterium]